MSKPRTITRQKIQEISISEWNKIVGKKLKVLMDTGAIQAVACSYADRQLEMFANTISVLKIELGYADTTITFVVDQRRRFGHIERNHRYVSTMKKGFDSSAFLVAVEKEISTGTRTLPPLSSYKHL